jgi:hypothetical protein
MKYLLLVCWDAETMNGQADPDPAETRDDESFPWLDDLQARGAWITGDQLAPPRRARSVRVRDGKPIVTDGPFAGVQGGGGRIRPDRGRQPGRGRRDRGSSPGCADGDDRGQAPLGDVT